MLKERLIDGLYADPDIIKYNDKYYIYPTTDGFDGWSGTYFKAFSSTDLQVWEDEGTILDLIEDVPWAIGSAWAPCMAVRDNKFYYYFCGKNKNGVSNIGVAISNSPIGPFYAQKEALITMELMQEYNIKMGQTIDPSVYEESGEWYILFGNGQGAIAKLNTDMISIEKQTLANIEGLYDFREAVTVFKRDDKYHFTWSCDDTGSENYHVNYGVSDSVYGPINFKDIILCKDKSKNCVGTGHHSIFYDKMNNEYYICYHRFATPLDKYTEGKKGFYRELCLDRIQFDEDGFIEKVLIGC